MHPKELKTKWSLTFTQLALFLGKSEQTVVKYCAPAHASTHIEPGADIIGKCWLLNYYFEREGGVRPMPFLFAA